MKILLPILIITQMGANGLSVPAQDRIVEGTNTTIEKHPYQVEVEVFQGHHCGGSILNKFYILTAAHCFTNLSVEYCTIRAGSSISNEGGIVRKIAQKFCHPQYNYLTHDYDICILKLEHPFPFNKKIAPIRLPKQNKRNDSVDNLVGIATGWGKLQPGGDSPKQLQMVKLPTWPQDVCKGTMHRRGALITERMFCAGYHEGGKDTCQGDSGGPLVAEDIVIGITSFGISCGVRESPGVYTRVSYFIDYINSIISN